MTWGAIVGTVVGVGASLISGSKAASASKEAAAEEARLERVVTDEKLRQLGVEQEVTRSDTIARVAGSGVKADIGSPLDILAAQDEEFAYARRATDRAGASRAANALQRGNLAATTARYSSYANAANSINWAGIFQGVSNRRGP